MIPNEAMILDATQQVLEAGVKSCLACIHFQFRDQGRYIICTKRLNILEDTATITADRLALARRRARSCKYYEGDDD